MKVRHFSLLGSLLTAVTFVAAGCSSEIVTYSKDEERHGMELYNQKQYTDAAGSFRNAARKNERNYKAYYMLGNCYVQTNQFQKAINAYRTSLDVQTVTLEGKYDHPQRATTITALAGAIAQCDSRDIEINNAVAKAKASQSGEDYLLLAKVYAFRGDADSAIGAFDAAALLAPNNFYVAKEYGLYLAQLGQDDRAERTLRRAYALNQQDEQVNLALRRIGVVPGPSLKPEKDLAGPPVPKGALPQWQFGKQGQQQTQPAPSAQQPSSPTVQAPRD